MAYDSPQLWRPRIGYQLARRSFEFLPASSTAKYQPLDLRLIEHSKIRYRSILLRCVILMIEARTAGRTKFTEDSGRGKWGIREG